jgi:FdhD protein
MSEAIKILPVHRVSGQALHAEQDHLVVEEPLEIRLNQQPLAVVMRTPGEDFNLARGFLLAEGILAERHWQEARHSLAVCWAQDELGLPIPNVVSCTFPTLSSDDMAQAQRQIYATSSCGICGRASLERIHLKAPKLPGHFAIRLSLLEQLPAKLAAAQSNFSHTGGLHAAGLFSAAGELIKVSEDIGRHNAVDKTIGWALAEGRCPLSDFGLLVSGRLSFEMAQKALLAGISFVAAISAASSLAVELGEQAGMTLVGFLRGEQAVIYLGRHRLFI